METQWQNQCVIVIIVLEGKEMGEKMNDTKIETDEDEIIEDAHTKRRLLFLRFSNIINDRNVVIALGKEKLSVSILSDEFYEEQAFPYWRM